MQTVIVFGTFDLLHPGHVSFLNQAQKLGDRLVVIVARDEFVRKIKGKDPKQGEKKRSSNVRNLGIADRVRLGSRTYNYFRTLRSENVDIIAMGYDQKPKITDLRKKLKRHRLTKIAILRLKPFKEAQFKSSKISTK